MDLAEQLRAIFAGSRRNPEPAADYDLVRINGDFPERRSASSVEAFEEGLRKSDKNMLLHDLCLRVAHEGTVCQRAPNLTVDLPVMHQLSKEQCTHLRKTSRPGNLMKTILAPVLRRGC